MDPICVRDMMPRLAVGLVIAAVAAVALHFFDEPAAGRPLDSTAAATMSDEPLTARM